ncbi:MAG TPA: leucyl aminopeptidase [Gammaproteobacteria bacterium]|nr:leucyl aminopeptidase [Gammaproteobacteria bacterium]
MEIRVKHTDIGQHKTDCAVIAVYEKRKLSTAGKALDQLAGGALTQVLKSGDMDGKSGQSLLLHGLSGLPCTRVLLIGLGREKDLAEKSFHEAVTQAWRSLSGTGARDATFYFSELAVGKHDTDWNIYQAARLLRHASYRYDTTRSKDDNGKPALRRLVLDVAEKRRLERARRALAEGDAVGEGMNLARELGNLPGNICTPSYLASEARKLARSCTAMSAQVLDQKAMEKLGMGSLLSVAKGSRQPPRFIILEYRGVRGTKAKPVRPVVLVGKGITFDSGGVSIKPSAAMDEMKFDMCGAASVLGTFRALAQLQPKAHVIGLVPSCENMPDGAANKPGDVVTAMSGKTIEVLNTDAEGRLILCDALTYAEKYKPRAVIDIATLTGACVVALGKHATGMLGNDDKLMHDLAQHGRDTGDRVWQLPLWDEYQDQLKSNFADIANIGGRDAGTITAACFLSRFTEKMKWAHLDIAGTAWESGSNKGATGRPVPLLTRYILSKAAKK